MPLSLYFPAQELKSILASLLFRLGPVGVADRHVDRWGTLAAPIFLLTCPVYVT